MCVLPDVFLQLQGQIYTYIIYLSLLQKFIIHVLQICFFFTQYMRKPFHENLTFYLTMIQLIGYFQFFTLPNTTIFIYPIVLIHEMIRNITWSLLRHQYKSFWHRIKFTVNHFQFGHYWKGINHKRRLLLSGFFQKLFRWCILRIL